MRTLQKIVTTIAGTPRRSITTAVAVLALATSLQAQNVATRVPVVDKQTKVGAGLYEIVVSEPTNSIWVASTGGGAPRVIELDATTLAEKRSISTADAPAYGLGINNRTQMLYTINTRANSVSAINLKTGAIVATIREGEGSAHVFRTLVDEVANKIYVSLPGSPSRIWVIDGATNTLEHVIADTGARSTGLALDRANNRLFTVSQNTAEVLEINLATRTVVKTYPSGGTRSTHLAFDAPTGRLFVTHQGSNNVTVLDTKTGQVLRAIETGATALGIGLDPRTNLIYVANRGGGNVTVINATTYAVVATLDAGTMPNTVAIDSRDGSVFVTNKARPAGRGGRAGAPGGRAGGAPGAPAAPGAVAPAPPAPPAAPAAPATPPPPDEGGDTVTRIVLPR